VKAELVQHSLLTEYKNIHFERKQTECIEFELSDAILFESLERSDNPGEMLRRAHSALNPQGAVFVAVKRNESRVAEPEWLTRFVEVNKNSVNIELCEAKGSNVVYILRNKSDE
jgi:hypothetical protein